MQYSAKFRERMIKKMTGPGGETANALSKDVGVHPSTLSRWLREAKVGPMEEEHGHGSNRGKSSGRRRWTPEEKIRLFEASAGLGEEELGAFLRGEGLHEAELKRMREEVQQAAAEGLRSKSKKRRKGLTLEQRELRAVKKELKRKDKALAEAAALLVLQGKVRAFLEADEEGDTDGSDDE
jgi:transposase-like protein